MPIALIWHGFQFIYISILVLNLVYALASIQEMPNNSSIWTPHPSIPHSLDFVLDWSINYFKMLSAWVSTSCHLYVSWSVPVDSLESVVQKCTHRSHQWQRDIGWYATFWSRCKGFEEWVILFHGERAVVVSENLWWVRRASERVRGLGELWLSEPLWTMPNTPQSHNILYCSGSHPS